MKAIRTFARLTPIERARLIEAVWMLTVATGLLKGLGFKRISNRVGRHMAEGHPLTDPSQIAAADLIRWAVRAVGDRLPWKPVCLPRALAAQWMLRRQGIPSTLYLGLDPDRALDAHAWVRAGPVVVAGGPIEKRFVVVSTFA
jgi:hypothetical protein